MRGGFLHPDSKNVIFARAGYPYNLYRREVSGTGIEERVTHSIRQPIHERLVRDGRPVLFHEISSDTLRELWILCEPETSLTSVPVGG